MAAERGQPPVPRARRVPHLRRRAGHRRGHAAAPARPDAEELPAGRGAHRCGAWPPARPHHPRRHVRDPGRPERPGGDDRLRAHRLRRRVRRQTASSPSPGSSLAEWTAGAADRVAALGLTPRRLARADLAGANAAVEELPRAEARDRTFALLGALYDTKGSTLAEKVGDDAESLLALVRAHPQIQELVACGGTGRSPGRPRRGVVSRAGERPPRPATRTTGSLSSPTWWRRSATSGSSLAAPRSAWTCTCGSASSPGSTASRARRRATCGATTAS